VGVVTKPLDPERVHQVVDQWCPLSSHYS
jgi:hypothetical protein